MNSWLTWLELRKQRTNWKESSARRFNLEVIHYVAFIFSSAFFVSFALKHFFCLQQLFCVLTFLNCFLSWKLWLYSEAWQRHRCSNLSSLGSSLSFQFFSDVYKSFFVFCFNSLIVLLPNCRFINVS